MQKIKQSLAFSLLSIPFELRGYIALWICQKLVGFGVDGMLRLGTPNNHWSHIRVDEKGQLNFASEIEDEDVYLSLFPEDSVKVWEDFSSVQIEDFFAAVKAHLVEINTLIEDVSGVRVYITKNDIRLDPSKLFEHVTETARKTQRLHFEQNFRR